MYKVNFLQNLRTIFISIVIATIVLSLARVTFLLNIAELKDIASYPQDLWHSLVMGLRFDLKVSCLFFVPLFFWNFLAAAKSNKWFTVVSRYYIVIVVFLFVLTSVSNCFYYKTYGNYFDIFMFNIIDGDSAAVMTSLWQDYPVIAMILFSALVAALSLWGLMYFQGRGRIAKASVVRVISLGLASTVVLFLLIRGSFGAFPLGLYDANVSRFSSFNKVTPNALMAIQWALQDYFSEEVIPPVSKQQLDRQMQKVIGQPTPVYHLPANAYLAKHKPNVFVVLMESMGTNFLVDDNKKTNDLLASLRPQFASDFLFKRFQAGTSETWDSIMMMLTQTNHPSISQSSYRHVRLKSLAVIPYKKAGYEVSFIYAGDGTWRNSKPYLLNQGFDHFYDKEDIINRYPKAQASAAEWGLADEYAFRFAHHLLATAKKPQMIFMMSITNHPPYKLPESYQVKPVHLTARLQKNVTNSHANALESERTYQYASNALGGFIHRIKNSSLADNTLIAASGDHHMRNINMNIAGEYGIAYAVPFYLYVPKNILQHVAYHYDNHRIGSHRDIFPTLYHFSLSDTDYITLGGQNLLKKGKVDNIGYNETRLMSLAGIYSKTRPQELYPWSRDLIHNKKTPVLNKHPHFLHEYDKLQDMYTRYQLHINAR